MASPFVYRLFWHNAKSYATKQTPSSAERGRAEAVDGAGAEAEVEVEAEVEEVPFAQATLISSEEAVMYETAAAVVASSAV